MTTPEYLNVAIIELTRFCNQQCAHCNNHSKSTEQGSYKKAFRLLDHLIRKTTVRQIMFKGGEPCISERFTDIVLHAKLHGKQVSVVTNGNGATDIYLQLAKMKVDLMEFSIYSHDPDVHDRMAGTVGSWYKAVNHMKLMLENGIPVTPVIVVTSLNYDDILATVHFLHKLGANHVIVNHYNGGTEGMNYPYLSVKATQLQDTFGKLDKYAEKYPVKLFAGECTPHCLLNPDDYPHICFDNCVSKVYKRPITFDLEGNLRLCNHSPVVIGNIFKQSLQEIFANPYLAACIH